MRVSTSQIYSSGTRTMSRNQYDTYKTQNQLSTGKRILAAADDPVAAAQAIVTSQQKEVNSHHAANQNTAKDQLALVENRLGSVTDVLQEVMSRMVEAGNGTYTDTDYRTLATTLQQRYDELLGLANSADAEGNYLFAGYSGAQQPFVASNGKLVYAGDDGARRLQVDADRFMEVAASGNDVFMRIPQSNGTFAAATTNLGTGMVDVASTISPTDRHTYAIRFNDTGVTAPDTAAKTYDIVDISANPGIDLADPATDVSSLIVPPAGRVYTSGEKISFGGVQTTITGAPSVTAATWDYFTITPATNKDVFTTLNDVITALNKGAGSDDTSKKALQDALKSGSADLSQAFNKVLDVRTSVGSRLSELESLSSATSARDLQYEESLSNLQEVDYIKGISDLTRQKMVLDAAQKSFVQISGLSLFDHL